ncbi:MAG: TIGR02594 family protein [Nitratireductor sp.]|nr:TIGR02594 family protein [Nitratireductor sp.]
MAPAVIFAVMAFGGMTFSGTEGAYANSARLAAIKRVQGMHERKNRKQIQAMVGVNPATTPWCGAAAAYAVRKAGGTPVAGANKASSWLKFGTAVPVKAARQGDVVVLRTKRGYHVTLFGGWADKGRFTGCGGNQSNRFQCSSYRVASIKAVRR